MATGSGVTNGVSFEFAPASLDRIKEIIGPDRYVAALDLAADNLTGVGGTAAAAATPGQGEGITPATGAARSKTVPRIQGRERAVVAGYPYARWLDTGTDSRGRVMRSRPGGYQIKAATMKAVREGAAQALAKAAREIVAGWGK